MKSRMTVIALVIAAFAFLPALALAGGDPPPPTGFKVYPNLQGVAQNSIGMMWQTHNADKGKVKIAANSNMSGAVTYTMSVSQTRQKATISGLAANTVYYYQVVADGETSPKGSFVTSLPKGSRLPFRFIVYGDSRDSSWYEDIVSKYGDNDDHLPVCISMNNYAPDFLVHAGDLVRDGNDTDLIYNFFDVEKELLANNPVLPAYGNHEFSGGNGTGNTTLDSFLLPPPGSPNFAYYSMVYGNVKIIVLNTGEGVFASDNFDIIKQGSTQWNWLYSQVASAAADADIDHIFITLHAPPFSCANFGDNTQVQNALNPVLALTGKVKAVFMGHEHDYQHLKKNGMNYILSGGAGSSMMDYPWVGDQDDTSAQLIKYAEVLNYLIVDVSGSSIHCEARSVQGNGSSTSALLESFNL
ncbi:MAG: metallophosphoesterase [Thermodesulfobacteriota bacterium]